MIKVYEIKQNIFKANEIEADHIREELKKEHKLLINIMSSPGSGKTTTLLNLIPLLKHRVGVMEADIDGSIDTKRMIEANIPAIQLHTGGMCHLDAEMTYQSLKEFDCSDLDIIVLENVGNLVCPAEFDTGSHLNMVILSVPEGDDKALKYPLMFEVCDVLIINKMDVLPYFDFDLDKCITYARNVNPNIKIYTISAKNNEGLEEVAHYIEDYYEKL